METNHPWNEKNVEKKIALKSRIVVHTNLFTPFDDMKKRRSNNLFGGPSSFSGATLLTYGEVGKQWVQTRIDLESLNPGTRITNVEVAKQVYHYLFTFFSCTLCFWDLTSGHVATEYLLFLWLLSSVSSPWLFFSARLWFVKSSVQSDLLVALFASWRSMGWWSGAGDQERKGDCTSTWEEILLLWNC